MYYLHVTKQIPPNLYYFITDYICCASEHQISAYIPLH